MSRMTFQLGYRVPCAGLFCLVLSSCAQWDQNPAGSTTILQQARKTPDTVILETWFVSASEADAQSESMRLWREIDEQHLPVETRHRLTANGLRCGLSGSQLPAWLQQLMDEHQQAKRFTLEDAGQAGSLASRQQVLHTRTGRISRVALTPNPQANLTLLVSEDGTVHGDVLEDAQAFMVVRAFPQGDGRVKVELTPEVEYGQPRQKWTGQEGVFILDTSRERKTYERLQTDVYLANDQTLVLGPTAELRGLGASFFGDASGSRKQRLLLIRIGSPQVDDLFSAEDAPPDTAAAELSL